MDDVKATDAMMAQDDEGRLLRQSVEAREFGRNGAHGDQFGAGDAGQLEFTVLANIDKRESLAGLNAALDIAGGDFERQWVFVHGSRRSNSG